MLYLYFEIDIKQLCIRKKFLTRMYLRDRIINFLFFLFLSNQLTKPYLNTSVLFDLLCPGSKNNCSFLLLIAIKVNVTLSLYQRYVLQIRHFHKYESFACQKVIVDYSFTAKVLAINKTILLFVSNCY